MKQRSDKLKIVLLASKGKSTNILYNAISPKFEISNVVIEDNVPLSKFLRYRYKKVGLIRLFDQLLFILTTSKLLSYMTKRRQGEILQQNGLDYSEIPETKILRVESVNSNKAIGLLQELKPDVILVNGTRILSKKLLSSVSAKVVNLHAGITPDYRGVHGAYWAYVNNSPHMAGVTLHNVDSGVDTGDVIGQARITTNKEDNFATYPLIQLAAGLVLLQKFLKAFYDGDKISAVVLPQVNSKQWYHPGFFEYLFNRILKNVK